jgi:hypothetical protein
MSLRVGAAFKVKAAEAGKLLSIKALKSKGRTRPKVDWGISKSYCFYYQAQTGMEIAAVSCIPPTIIFYPLVRL